jgi:hypothetical protein
MSDDDPAWTHRYPRGDAKAGRLRFESGLAPRVVVRGAALGDELARCHFEGDAPRVEAREGELTIDYRGFFRWFFLGRMSPGVIEINDAMPWAILVEGGVARTELDLARVQLTRFEVSGGAARVELRLGKPSGVVPVRLSGGAAKLRITQPPGVGARIKVGGGVAHLDFLEQSLGAVGGGVALESRKWDPQGDGYDIKIGGGAAHVSVETEGSA